MWAQKHSQTHELILTDVKGNVYEGLSSNFFAIRDGAIETAPLDAVLPGTIQKLVFDVASQLKIPMRYVFPNIAQVAEWEGAFITSTSRAVLPISSIYFP